MMRLSKLSTFPEYFHNGIEQHALIYRFNKETSHSNIFGQTHDFFADIRAVAVERAGWLCGRTVECPFGWALAFARNGRIERVNRWRGVRGQTGKERRQVEEGIRTCGGQRLRPRRRGFLSGGPKPGLSPLIPLLSFHLLPRPLGGGKPGKGIEQDARPGLCPTIFLKWSHDVGSRQ